MDLNGWLHYLKILILGNYETSRILDQLKASRPELTFFFNETRTWGTISSDLNVYVDKQWRGHWNTDFFKYILLFPGLDVDRVTYDLFQYEPEIRRECAQCFLQLKSGQCVLLKPRHPPTLFEPWQNQWTPLNHKQFPITIRQRAYQCLLGLYDTDSPLSCLPKHCLERILADGALD